MTFQIPIYMIDKSCNCRKKETCPLEGGDCSAENVVKKVFYPSMALIKVI